MKPRKPLGVRTRSQAGLTLVELMVSVALGLLLVAALVTLLININRNNTALSVSNRLIENGRYTLQLLEADLVHAGYWGGFVPRFDDLINADVPDDVPSAVADLCAPFGSWTATDRNNLVGIALHSIDIPNPASSPPAPVCAGAGGPIQNPRPDSDIIFLRYAQKCGANCLTATPAGNQRLFVQVQRCGSTLGALGYQFGISGLAFQNVRCDGPSEIRQFVSRIYYVRDVSGVPTLMRSDFGVVGGQPAHESAQAMIDGVEAIRIAYGFDTVSDAGEAVDFTRAIDWASAGAETSPRNRGDGIPDGAYVRCTTASPCTAAQWMNAVSVTVHVLVRADQRTPGHVDTKTYNLGGVSMGPFNDDIRRHVFSKTIRLTNVSGRRETP